ncbi:hypothetical protein TeGR_g10489 [Tetraparma gracilis]|uniref:Thiamine-triphosphatase n=1 Tax=Tetraparma gracilis TaxID=2962635 RepID=A0ABQ6N4U9_9STRA|nr:hypothetical protein TeGR_g10489 [Tetraparma gracilis]
MGEGGRKRSSGGRTTYREYDGVRDVVQEIRKVSGGGGEGAVEGEVISAHVPGLEPYANFQTRRRAWSVAGGVHVVVDESDIGGFAVGEVEVLVKEEDVAAAGERLDEAKRLLGISTGEVLKDGKLFMFVKRYNPKFLAMAQAAGTM